MKKIVAILFISGLVLASCSKKETAATETNTMLSEPDTPTIPDSATVIEPMAADSTVAKP